MQRLLLGNDAQPQTDIFNANSDYCLAYWLDSSNVDHFHIHMIETCACVALVFMIVVYLNCKKMNIRKLHMSMPLSSSHALEDTTTTTTLLTDNNLQKYYQNTQTTVPTNATEMHKTPSDVCDVTLNADEWSSSHPNDIQNPNDLNDIQNEQKREYSDETENDRQEDSGVPTIQTFFYDDSTCSTISKKGKWNICAKFTLFTYRRNKKKYKKKYGTYPQSIVKKAKKSAKDPILLPCFMKLIYLFLGGVTFKFIISSLASNNLPGVHPFYDNRNGFIILNCVVSWLDTVLWYSLAFLLIQKSSSKRAFIRAIFWGFLFALVLCAIYGFAYSLGEPIAWNLSSILLLIYYGSRVWVCIVLIAFMYIRRYNHNRWKRWSALRFLIVFLFTINAGYLLAVISMSLSNCRASSQVYGVTDASTNVSALLDICWFTLVELIRNLIQPFILYATLLKDTDYWRQLAKLITMSSATGVPRKGGTLDLSIENYRDIEAFARTTRVPVLDFTDFELRKPIGRGATASVYRAYYRGYPVACKDLSANLMDEITYESVHRFCREALLFIHIQHINIIKFFGICLRPPALYLVFELATHGTLRNLLDSSARKRKRTLREGSTRGGHMPYAPNKAPLTWPDKLWLALDIATGMQVLHSKDIIHRDLNTNNVLVTFMKEEGRLVAKICDFGLARKLSNNHQDRVHSSFLASSPAPPKQNNSFNQHSLSVKPRKYTAKSRKSNNSLPPIIGSGSSLTCSVAGAAGGAASDTNGYMTSEAPHQHKSKKKKRHRKRKKRDKEQEESVTSLKVSSSNDPITPNPPLPPRFNEIPELTGLDDTNKTYDKSNVSLDAESRSLGGTMAIVEAGNSLDFLTTECGTVSYMAPELLQHLNITKHFTYATDHLVLYTKSIDVYSFGLILWEICTEQVLYEEMDDLKDIRQYVLNGNRPHIPSYILGTYAGLMKDAWSASPLHRPDFDEICRRLQVMLGLSRCKSEDNSLYSWTLVDAMRDSGRY
eukprot:306918_1